MKDGSLFVPAVLLAKHKPFDAVTRSRLGSYWNLVMPYAWRPDSSSRTAQANEILRHARTARGCSGSCAPAPTRSTGEDALPVTGTDQVYGLAVARFLADNDQPDRSCSASTACSARNDARDVRLRRGGDGRSAQGRGFRSMYLPPNAASNSAFLETLRLMLVHETTAPNGRPVGLELAFRTPRGWLAAGKSVAVRESPTSFGPLSYEIDAGFGQITATVDVPERRPPLTMKLRLRVPAGHRVLGVRVDGKRRPFDRKTATVDLSGLRGTLSIVAAVR